MSFTLRPYAALKGNYITRFIDNPEDIVDEERVLPVIADPDPELGPDERLWGPDYEVLEDRVRAYSRAVLKDPEEILADRIRKLDELIAALEAKGV